MEPMRHKLLRLLFLCFRHCKSIDAVRVVQLDSPVIVIRSVRIIFPRVIRSHSLEETKTSTTIRIEHGKDMSSVAK